MRGEKRHQLSEMFFVGFCSLKMTGLGIDQTMLSYPTAGGTTFGTKQFHGISGCVLAAKIIIEI